MNIEVTHLSYNKIQLNSLNHLCNRHLLRHSTFPRRQHATSSLFAHELNVHISVHLSPALTQQQLASQARLHEHANNSKTSSEAGLDPSQVNATLLSFAETFQPWFSGVGTAGFTNNNMVKCHMFRLLK